MVIDERPITGSEQNPSVNGSRDFSIGGTGMGAATIGAEQAKKLMGILQEYKSGKVRTEQRIISSQNWWKLRNTMEEQKETEVGIDRGFTSKSGWLHNVITSKHADYMKAYPEAILLPREEGDRAEAKVLTAIVPCILEQNHFEDAYNKAGWDKMITGTGAYKVVWDQSKLNGLGDISIIPVNILNLYWEPGKTDIQKSRYLFHTELVDKDLLQEQYPQLEGKLKSQDFVSAKFLYDDTVKTDDKATVIECYYHKRFNGRSTLQYVKFVGDNVLYATENDPQMAQRGLYDHGKYPYRFDTLFPIEGSPCGYGFVDICKNPQTELDLMKTAFVKNAMVGATPRYFQRVDGGVNEQELLDLSKPIVHVNGNLGEDSLRQMTFSPLPSVYVSLMDQTVQELRETSGNTETATGSGSGGVTAASGIAALQEASGKGSADATMASYRAFSDIVDMVIELVRQFYDMPRQYRIVGDYGMEQFITYSNAHLKPQHQGVIGGQDMGYRLPVFDIKVSAQKRNAYNRVAQNELAIQLFQLGFFNPQMVDQALMTLDIMDFDGKDGIMQKVARQGTMFQKMVQYMELALSLAQVARPDMVPGLSQDIMATVGGGAPSGMVGGLASLSNGVGDANADGMTEHPVVEKARAQSQQASSPEEGPKS